MAFAALLLLPACASQGDDEFEQAASPLLAPGPQPSFQLPFPCGEAWNGDANNSSAHRSYEIDFNLAGGGQDLGRTVVAAAAGTVVTSSYQTNNGYGNLVVIDHGGGWRSYYAHLRARSVGAGANVAQGQKIGELGNTSATNPGISPHLHYEVRNTEAGTYPANIQRATFDGIAFNYSGSANQNITSRNCNDPVAVCGGGFRVIDRAYLDASGTHHGTVYLLYNASNSNNCVVTVRHRSRGTASATSAYVEPQGATRVTDSGTFFEYAGPATKAAPGCVKWGGAIGTVAYNSPFEHCG